ncbi:hypothetical protein H0I55_00150 [Yersinia kristensenii]|uniref:hypothetical protein n=1 Tax=Yersinia kristensenii TaxID=28152 RepID=UPI001C60B52A|nr:hypothetical protein [Yersinia kristensenii]MBW5810494.1 hypothetical protein [Yersinia kristensenii]
MQEKMYISELVSKIEFLARNYLISKHAYENFMNLVNKGQFDTLEEKINDIFIHNNLNPDISKHFSVKENTFEETSGPSIDYNESKSLYLERMRMRKLENDNDELISKVSTLLNKLSLIESKYKSSNSDFLELKLKYDELESIYKDITSEVRQKKIDEEIPNYVEDVSGKLEKDDQFFTDMARNWSIIGVSVTLFAVLAAFCTFTQGTDLLVKNPDSDFIGLLYIFIRGALGIGLLSWLAYVCFSNSRNYTHESIRRKDRQHALSFGRLFLQIYGSSAEKKETIEVFKDWNMSGDSAFSKENNKTPPNIIDAFKSFSGSLKKNKEE